MTDDDLEYLVEDTLDQMSRLDTMTLAELRLVACFCGAPGSEFHDPDRAAKARRLVQIKLSEMSPAERQFDIEHRAALMRVITPLLKSIRLFEAEAGRKAEPDEIREFCRIACREENPA
jgi:hypothetical protein